MVLWRIKHAKQPHFACVWKLQQENKGLKTKTYSWNWYLIFFINNHSYIYINNQLQKTQEVAISMKNYVCSWYILN